MTATDKQLLQAYYNGFDAELSGEHNKKPTTPELYKAYHMGQLDAVAGDDVASADEQTEEEILKEIKSTELKKLSEINEQDPYIKNYDESVRNDQCEVVGHQFYLTLHEYAVMQQRIDLFFCDRCGQGFYNDKHPQSNG